MRFDSGIGKERGGSGSFPDLSPIPQVHLACDDGTNDQGVEEKSPKAIPQLPSTSMISKYSRRFSSYLFPIVEEQDENVYNQKAVRRKSIATFESTRATNLLDQAKRRLSVKDTLANIVRDEERTIGFNTHNENSKIFSSPTPAEQSNSNLPTEQHGSPSTSFENEPSKISTPVSVGPNTTSNSAHDGSVLVLAKRAPKTPLSENRDMTPSGSLILKPTPRSSPKRKVRFAVDEDAPKNELQTLSPVTPATNDDAVSYSVSPDIDEDHPELQNSIISISSVNLSFNRGKPVIDSASETVNKGSVRSLQRRPSVSHTSSSPDQSLTTETIDSLTPSSILDRQLRSPRKCRRNEDPPVPSTPQNTSRLSETSGGREGAQFGSMTTVSHNNTHVYTPPERVGEAISSLPGSLNEIERTKVELGVTSSKFIQHVRGASIRRKLHIARSRDSLFEKERQQLQANEEICGGSEYETERPQNVDQGHTNFKARPYPRKASGSAGESGVPKVEKRSTTQPLSPKLGQYRRRDSKTHRESTSTSTFKARAVPKSVTSQGDGGMSGVPKIPTRARTVPASPMLGSRRKPPMIDSLSSTKLVDGSGGYMGVPKVAKRPTTVPESPLLGNRRPISPNKHGDLSLAGLPIMTRLQPTGQARKINNKREEDESTVTPPSSKYGCQVRPFVPHSTRRAERRATYDVHRNIQEEQRREEQESRRQAQLQALKRRLEMLRKSI